MVFFHFIRKLKSVRRAPYYRSRIAFYQAKSVGDVERRQNSIARDPFHDKVWNYDPLKEKISAKELIASTSQSGISSREKFSPVSSVKEFSCYHVSLIEKGSVT